MKIELYLPVLRTKLDTHFSLSARVFVLIQRVLSVLLLLVSTQRFAVCFV